MNENQNMIDIRDFNDEQRAELLFRLGNNSQLFTEERGTNHLDFYQETGGELSIEKAKKRISKNTYIDYFFGRVINIQFGQNVIDCTEYNKHCPKDAKTAQEIVGEMKREIATGANNATGSSISSSNVPRVKRKAVDNDNVVDTDLLKENIWFFFILLLYENSQENMPSTANKGDFIEGMLMRNDDILRQLLGRLAESRLKNEQIPSIGRRPFFIKTRGKVDLSEYDRLNNNPLAIKGKELFSKLLEAIEKHGDNSLAIMKEMNFYLKTKVILGLNDDIKKKIKQELYDMHKHSKSKVYNDLSKEPNGEDLVKQQLSMKAKLIDDFWSNQTSIADLEIALGLSRGSFQIARNMWIEVPKDRAFDVWIENQHLLSHCLTFISKINFIGFNNNDVNMFKGAMLMLASYIGLNEPGDLDNDRILLRHVHRMYDNAVNFFYLDPKSNEALEEWRKTKNAAYEVSLLVQGLQRQRSEGKTKAREAKEKELKEANAKKAKEKELKKAKKKELKEVQIPNNQDAPKEKPVSTMAAPEWECPIDLKSKISVESLSDAQKEQLTKELVDQAFGLDYQIRTSDLLEKNVNLNCGWYCSAIRNMDIMHNVLRSKTEYSKCLEEFEKLLHVSREKNNKKKSNADNTYEPKPEENSAQKSANKVLVGGDGLLYKQLDIESKYNKCKFNLKILFKNKDQYEKLIKILGPVNAYCKKYGNEELLNNFSNLMTDISKIAGHRQTITKKTFDEILDGAKGIESIIKSLLSHQDGQVVQAVISSSDVAKKSESVLVQSDVAKKPESGSARPASPQHYILSQQDLAFIEHGLKPMFIQAGEHLKGMAPKSKPDRENFTSEAAFRRIEKFKNNCDLLISLIDTIEKEFKGNYDQDLNEGLYSLMLDIASITRDTKDTVIDRLVNRAKTVISAIRINEAAEYKLPSLTTNGEASQQAKTQLRLSEFIPALSKLREYENLLGLLTESKFYNKTLVGPFKNAPLGTLLAANYDKSRAIASSLATHLDFIKKHFSMERDYESLGAYIVNISQKLDKLFDKKEREFKIDQLKNLDSDAKIVVGEIVAAMDKLALEAKNANRPQSPSSSPTKSTQQSTIASIHDQAAQTHVQANQFQQRRSSGSKSPSQATNVMPIKNQNNQPVELDTLAPYKRTLLMNSDSSEMLTILANQCLSSFTKISVINDLPISYKINNMVEYFKSRLGEHYSEKLMEDLGKVMVNVKNINHSGKKIDETKITEIRGELDRIISIKEQLERSKQRSRSSSPTKSTQQSTVTSINNDQFRQSRSRPAHAAANQFHQSHSGRSNSNSALPSRF